MVFLILAIFSSAMVAIVMRTAQTKVANPTGLLAGNYIVCVLIGLLLSVSELRSSAFSGLPFSIGLGILHKLLPITARLPWAVEAIIPTG